MSSSKRGTGKTTKQLKEAPLYSVFIWCNNNLHYPIALARSLKRIDIKIVAPNWIESDEWHGIKLSGVIIDHAAELTPIQCEIYWIILNRLSKRGHYEF